MPRLAVVEGAGEKIRRHRERMKLSQTAFGEIVKTPANPHGVSQATISRWERGEGEPPSIPQCDRLATVFGLSHGTVRMWWDRQDVESVTRTFPENAADLGQLAA